MKVDRVKISSIQDFASPSGVGEKVVAVERAKEGVFDAKLLASSASRTPMNEKFPAYDLEYNVESQRGNNHFVVKTSVIDQKLYVFTVQCREEDFPLLKDEMLTVLDSVAVAPVVTMDYNSRS